MSTAPLDDLVALLDRRYKDADLPDDERAKAFRLRNLVVRSVHLVDKGANGRRFVVIKRSGIMDPKLGQEVVDTGGGEFGNAGGKTTVEKAYMAPDAKAKLVQKLTALLKAVEGAEEKEGAPMPPDLAAQLKALASTAGGYPAPTAKAEPPADDDDPEAAGKKKKKKPEDDDLGKNGPGVQTIEVALQGIELSPAVQKFADELTADIAKRGGTDITPKQADKLKKLFSGFQEMVDELDGADADRATVLMKGAFADLAGAQRQTAGALASLIEHLEQRLPIGGAVPAGQASSGQGGKKKVAKAAEDPNDASWCGLDLNDDQLHPETADPETYFG